MNKQEALKKLEKIEIENSFGHWVGYYGAKELIEQIGPEKPVVPRFVAEWIEKSKTVAAGTLKGAYINAPEKVRLWWNGDNVANVQLFARAWLDGYEVEKEKLYTARLKINGKERDSYINRVIESGEIYLSNLTSIEGKLQVHFTQTELKELHYWNNPAFEIEEVSNE